MNRTFLNKLFVKTVLRRCLEMLEDADPTGEVADPGDLQVLEESALSQAPLIDARLAHVDRQHNLLAEVDVKIRDVLALYDSAVQQVSMHYQVGHFRERGVIWEL